MDIAKYAIHKNAMIGLPNSGKSWHAMWWAEQLMDAGYPIVAIDPVGIWQGLKIGVDNNKGYPVVVAGGFNPDIELTEDNVEDILRAALKARISIVFDMFSKDLRSKASQYRVVSKIADLLYMENMEHGICHLFVEEASQFIPQTIQPQQTHVYSKMEELARMGRNMGVGMTIINQRAEQVNKSVLEICEHSFWHRQAGKNSIKAIENWLKSRQDEDYKEVLKKIPNLKQGECYLMGEGEKPTLIQVPKRKTFHPDPTKMGETKKLLNTGVDVSTFVAELKSLLVKPAPSALDSEVVSENKLEASGINPKSYKLVVEVNDRLKRENEQLKTDLALLKANTETERKEFITREDVYRRALKTYETNIQGLRQFLTASVIDHTVPAIPDAPLDNFIPVDQLLKSRPAIPTPAIENLTEKAGQTKPALPPTHAPEKQTTSKAKKLGTCIEYMVTLLYHHPKEKFTKYQMAALTGYSVTSSGFSKAISILLSGRFVLRNNGYHILNFKSDFHQWLIKNKPPFTYSNVIQNLTTCEANIYQVLVNNPESTFNNVLLAKASGYSETSSGFVNALSKLKAINLLQKEGKKDQVRFCLHPEIVELFHKETKGLIK